MSNPDQLAEWRGQVTQKLDQILETLPDHEKRLRIVEKRVWVASGGAALVAFVVAHFKGWFGLA